MKYREGRRGNPQECIAPPFGSRSRNHGMNEMISQTKAPRLNVQRLSKMLRASAGFLTTLILTLLGLTAITFVLARIVPLDPVLVIVGDQSTNETYARVKDQLGLNEPLVVQYMMYLKSLLVGDLGTSILTSRPIVEDLLSFFPVTLELAILGILAGVILGVPLGVWSAVSQGRWPDQVIRVAVLFGYSAPVFWVGLMALMIFYGKLDWASGPGRLDFIYQTMIEARTNMILIDTALTGQGEIFRNALSHIVLPASLMGVYSIAYISRMTRSLMLDQLNQEYILTARVKGLTESMVLWKHAFRNTLIPLITIIVLGFASLLEGAILVETIFAWPGIGLYITNSLFNGDVNAVLGGTILIGTVFVSLNVLSDMLYRYLDPRAS